VNSDLTWHSSAAADALDALAGRLGSVEVEIEEVETSLRDAGETLRSCAPALLTLPDGRLLALAGPQGERMRLLCPDGRLRSATAAEIEAIWTAPWDSAAGPEVERLLDAAGLQGRHRRRARSALLLERLGGVRLQGLSLLRLPPGSSFRRQARWAGLHRAFLGFAGSYAVSYILLLASWAALGASVFQGHLVRGGLVAWGLLLATLLPFRMMCSWSMAKLTVRGGALLKRRLLAGALKLQPEEIRDQGVGRLLGRVLESEAVETLTLNGGFLTVVGFIEIAVSAFLLAAGAGGVRHAGLLALWLLASLGLSRRYCRERHVWTEQRLEMTHALVERLVGHRTRLAQENRDHWHDEDDRLLATYLTDSRRFDRTKALLLSAVPRGWLVVGLCGVLPGFLAGSASTGLLAVAVGGILTAFRGFGKFAEGFSKLSIAAVAWQQAGALFRAAARSEEPGAVSLPASQNGAVLEGVDLTFRHRDRGRPVLDGCDLEIAPGDRILLEGASGSGKSTLAALLAGLREPAAGLVLLDGFDRRSLGAEAWRRRVALAPQFHENHVFTETFAFNLLMGRRWPPTPADLDAATAVCREIGLGDLLQRMPSGLQQIVGESGWQLSHGERSRLYMARALLQGAGTVLLDESFAALDPENLDQALDCALRRAPALVVIAHP
jgi:ATP-binding cassette subfamily B protein